MGRKGILKHTGTNTTHTPAAPQAAKGVSFPADKSVVEFDSEEPTFEVDKGDAKPVSDNNPTLETRNKNYPGTRTHQGKHTRGQMTPNEQAAFHEDLVGKPTNELRGEKPLKGPLPENDVEVVVIHSRADVIRNMKAQLRGEEETPINESGLGDGPD